nr:hypothetical protein [uncultured Flavobacterium sp.]
MEKLRAELNFKLKCITHVYMGAQDAYLYTEYFHNPSTKDELNLVVKSVHSSSISVIMHLMFRTLIVEISKLYSQSKNDRFQLGSFVNSLSHTGHFAKIGVEPRYIERWTVLLADNRPIIQNIRTLRNKLYAHTENPMAPYGDIDITFKQIKTLLEIASEIITCIYRDVFDADIQLSSPSFDRERFSLLKLLVKAENSRLSDIYKKYRSI